jgi:hypothetical protein
MIRVSIERALHRATCEEREDGTSAGEVAELQGVLALAGTLEACRLPTPGVDGVKVAVTGTD